MRSSKKLKLAGSAGFTLIEALIVVAIMLLLAGAGSRLIIKYLKSYKKIEINGQKAGAISSILTSYNCSITKKNTDLKRCNPSFPNATFIDLYDKNGRVLIKGNQTTVIGGFTFRVGCYTGSWGMYGLNVEMARFLPGSSINSENFQRDPLTNRLDTNAWKNIVKNAPISTVDPLLCSSEFGGNAKVGCPAGQFSTGMKDDNTPDCHDLPPLPAFQPPIIGNCDPEVYVMIGFYPDGRVNCQPRPLPFRGPTCPPDQEYIGATQDGVGYLTAKCRPKGGVYVIPKDCGSQIIAGIGADGTVRCADAPVANNGSGITAADLNKPHDNSVTGFFYRWEYVSGGVISDKICITANPFVSPAFENGCYCGDRQVTHLFYNFVSADCSLYGFNGHRTNCAAAMYQCALR